MNRSMLCTFAGALLAAACLVSAVATAATADEVTIIGAQAVPAVYHQDVTGAAAMFEIRNADFSVGDLVIGRHDNIERSAPTVHVIDTGKMRTVAAARLTIDLTAVRPRYPLRE